MLTYAANTLSYNIHSLSIIRYRNNNINITIKGKIHIQFHLQAIPLHSNKLLMGMYYKTIGFNLFLYVCGTLFFFISFSFLPYKLCMQSYIYPFLK